MQTKKYSFRLLLFVFASLASGEEASRIAIQKAIPYLENKGEAWIREKKCVSCHQVNSMLWALSLSKSKGFEVNPKLAEWKNWAVDESLRQAKEGKSIGRSNKEGVAQLLLGLPSITHKKRAQLHEILSKDRRKDGTWKAGGQLPEQKRPPHETDMVSTMWIALSNPENASPESIYALDSDKPAKSVEWYALRILLSERIGGSKTSSSLDSLLKSQNSDGGWGWLLRDSSDALGTGLALYALQKINDPKNREAISKAQEFLNSSQSPNGTWLVRGTKKKKMRNFEETSTYWGTAWAVIALASSLSEPHPDKAVPHP